MGPEWLMIIEARRCLPDGSILRSLCWSHQEDIFGLCLRVKSTKLRVRCFNDGRGAGNVLA